MRSQSIEHLPVPAALQSVVHGSETNGVPVDRDRLSRLLHFLTGEDDPCAAQAREVAGLRRVLAACHSDGPSHGIDVTYRVSATSGALVCEPNLDALVAHHDLIVAGEPVSVVDVAANPWLVLAHLSRDPALTAVAHDAVTETWKALGPLSRPAVEDAMWQLFFTDVPRPHVLGDAIAHRYRAAFEYVTGLRLVENSLATLKREVSARTNAALCDAADLANDLGVTLVACLGGGHMAVCGAEEPLGVFCDAVSTAPITRKCAVSV